VRRYLAARLLQALGVVIFVTTLSFFVVHLAPGDPINTALQHPNVTEEMRQQWRAAYGLDKSVTEQYVRWVSNVARGKLGFSITHRRPVAEVLALALPRTLLLCGLALLLSFAIGIGIGLLQAERAGGARDRWLGRVLLVLYSVPDFWLALLALLLFAYRFPLFPAGGMTDDVTYNCSTASSTWCYLSSRWRCCRRPASHASSARRCSRCYPPIGCARRSRRD
jgi:peptide/nickel transport system permease protein